jgi:integrase
VRYRGLTDTWVRPALGDQKADRVLPRQIEAALAAMRNAGLSQSSIHQTFTLLNGTYKWARRNRYVTSNPMIDAEEPRSVAVPHEVVPPDIAQLRKVLAAALEEEPDFGTLCHLGAVTGMRRGELAGLRWDRVDLDQGRIRVEVTVNDAGGQLVIDNFTKTRKTRAVSVDAGTISLLTDHRRAMEQRASAVGCLIADEAFVFSHSPGCAKPIRPEYLTRRMRQIRRRLGLEAADIDTTLQALRHWAQTTLTEAGYNSRQVAARGGHSEQLMKAVYVHRTQAAEELMSDHLGALLTEARRPLDDAQQAPLRVAGGEVDNVHTK